MGRPKTITFGGVLLAIFLLPLLISAVFMAVYTGVFFPVLLFPTLPLLFQIIIFLTWVTFIGSGVTILVQKYIANARKPRIIYKVNTLRAQLANRFISEEQYNNSLDALRLKYGVEIE